MDPALRDAVLGSANIQAPTSPLGSFPELAQLYQSRFQLPQSSSAAGAGVNLAQQKVAEEKAAKEAAKKAKENYQRVKNTKDGGYNFYDGNGNPISAYEYANALGKNPADVLSDSENPIDIGFQQDYKNLQDYINAKLNSKHDENSAKVAQQIEQQVKDAHGIDLSSLNPDQLINQFKEAYPTVYGATKSKAFSNQYGGNVGRGVPYGQTFIPQAMSPNQVDLTGGGGIGG